MKAKLTIVAVAALAIGLIAAGCGDDEEDSLTHEEFVTQANEICTEGNAELEEAGSDLQAGPGSPEFEAFVADTLVPNVQGQIQDIRDLGIPEEDEELNETLDEAELITQDLAEDPGSLGRDGEDPFAPVNEELSAAGLTECAS